MTTTSSTLQQGGKHEFFCNKLISQGHYITKNLFFSLFLRSEEEGPPPQKARKQVLMALADAFFCEEEQKTFSADMLEIAAESALYLWSELDPYLRRILDEERIFILDTLARSVTRNHALYTLHQKHGRNVAMPDQHRILHSPGSHLFTALQK